MACLRGTFGLVNRKAYSTLRDALTTAPLLRSVPATMGTVQTTTLKNGITVISEDGGVPLSTVLVVVAAGSRNETVSSAGSASLIHAMAYQSTKNRSGLWITRETEAAGADLSASFDREVISYNCTFLRNETSIVLDNLADAVTGQLFLNHELQDGISRATASANVCTKNVVMDALMEGAFRTGLGRPSSPFPENLANLTTESLTEYMQSNFTGNRIVVVGNGVSHDELVHKVTKAFPVSPTGAALAPAKYYGDASTRIRTGDNHATFAVGYQGFAISSKHALAGRVLSNILGCCTRLPFGQSRISNGHAFNLNFSDSGLFGYVLNVKSAEDVATNMKRVNDILSGNFTSATVNAAKAVARSAIAEQTWSQRVQSYAAQAIGKAAISSPEQQVSLLDALTDADIQAAAKAIKSSKPTLVAYGNVDLCPYPDEL